MIYPTKITSHNQTRVPAPSRSNRNPHLRSTQQQIHHPLRLPKIHLRTRFSRTRPPLETKRTRNRLRARSPPQSPPGRHIHPRQEHLHLLHQPLRIHQCAASSPQASTLFIGYRSGDPRLGESGENPCRGAFDQYCGIDFGACLYGESNAVS